MKLFITGGCGFIGSNFIRYMLNKYDDVRIYNFDSLTYAGQGDNLRDIEYDDERYRFIKGDITGDKVGSWINSNNFDAIINFAAESHVDRSILNPNQFILTNVLGTQNLLNASIRNRNKVPRFIHISTDEVYGSLGRTGKFTEQTYIKPNSPYAASKASSDMLVQAAFKTHKLPAIITRCSNNYGHFQHPEKLIPLMITNAMEGKKLHVYGDGKNVRDWIHVIDHCKAIECVLNKGKEGEIYNIGGDCERSNIEIVEKIVDEVGGEIEFVKDRKGHDFRYAMDYSKIKNELGWKPEYNFVDGIFETIKWYKNNKWWWKPLKHNNGCYEGAFIC